MRYYSASQSKHTSVQSTVCEKTTVIVSYSKGVLHESMRHPQQRMAKWEVERYYITEKALQLS